MPLTSEHFHFAQGEVLGSVRDVHHEVTSNCGLLSFAVECLGRSLAEYAVKTGTQAVRVGEWFSFDGRGAHYTYSHNVQSLNCLGREVVKEIINPMKIDTQQQKSRIAIIRPVI